MPYTLTRREMTRLRGRLTRAINSRDPDKVKAERDYAFAIFDEHGYPDEWARWERAADDAAYRVGRLAERREDQENIA